MRKQNHIIAAPKAIPTTGPMTTPEIQMLLFDDGIGVDVCDVGCDAPGFEKSTLVVLVMTLAGVVTMLEDVVITDMAPEDVFSIIRLELDVLKTYYWTEQKVCWMFLQGH